MFYRWFDRDLFKDSMGMGESKEESKGKSKAAEKALKSKDVMNALFDSYQNESSSEEEEEGLEGFRICQEAQGVQVLITLFGSSYHSAS